ncbi:glycosyltransferase family 8 protein [Entomospira culicis]|uniref:Glycosyltransferase family 8 protein n=1 Tax=Entomospira culicis TaxID=2719989 RepID=A0A968GGH5_9SPIO|nr:glycosyltransferase family 8 protein [Entomospira culicis]NIZ19668.1 glycosyltransferase family 8 protein [Entomospira culicis]NIZ69882.1 glycosyltransferase family 8 protein [Entomospira culicis]WDI36987.1 glycosyltransferase family 8 protein [Entomospira culicis]WDI38616.1 glycosyltransferase family 8 protein [Entomospira culicis]
MIPVIFAINQAYTRQLRVALLSLYRHAKEATQYQVYVLHYDVTIDSQELICAEQEKLHTRGALEFVRLSDEQYTKIPLVGRWGKETNFRLLLPELIPKGDKVIYLDTDVLVLADLADLFRTQLDDCWLAAAMEERAGYRNYTIASFMAQAEAQELTFVPQRSPYINAGVLVLNVALMREKDITPRALHLLARLPAHWFENSRYDFFLMPDQDILYYLAYQSSKGVRHLPDRYNHIVGYYYYKDMPKFASQEAYAHWLGYIDSLAGKHASQTWEDYQPAIIHYADSAPWSKRRGLVPYEALYRAYAKEIGWKLPNKWLINLITWAKRRFFYRKTTRDAWGRKGMALLALNMLMVGLVLMIMTIWLVF